MWYFQQKACAGRRGWIKASGLFVRHSLQLERRDCLHGVGLVGSMGEEGTLRYTLSHGLLWGQCPHLVFPQPHLKTSEFMVQRC